MQVYLPNDYLNVNHANDFGIVQIVDMQGNSVIPTTDIKTKIISSNTKVAQTNDDVMIPKGFSYAMFLIETEGSVGQSIITASANGVIPNTANLNTLVSYRLTYPSAVTNISIEMLGHLRLLY